ncbi:hypothetical protein MMC32_003806 [Xylographa parallela]|nr:hypothetical protein [Xylographa parallela]
MDYWPESPQWAGVAKNLEEYLREQSKATKFRREKEKYRCKRPHFDQQPSGAQRRSSTERVYTAPQWPPMQPGWADPRPPLMQQDWHQDRVPGHAPNRPLPQTRNYSPRYPDDELEEDDLDEDDQAQNSYSPRSRPSNQRRGVVPGGGRNRQMRDDNRVVYDSDDRVQRSHRPQRAGQRYHGGNGFTRSRPTKGRHKPHDRPYESDPEGRFGRNPYRGRQPSDDFDRPESQDRRMENEGREGEGVTDGA